ncbi:MAG: tRNA (adenosine(37)-N6)-dimethylallyltransferase MiaA [Marinifilaceae bacterium]
MFNLLAIVGPTASGKTSLAVSVANRLHGEIISGDSRQVYRGMDLGTGKDLEEYTVNGHTIPSHLIDIVEAGEKYNLFQYQQDFIKVWEDCNERKVFPVLCGGSGLYVESVLKGYKLLPVPENPQLREALANCSLPELAAKLETYKKLHNTTEVDTVKRAIRAIEIEEYYMAHPEDEPTFPTINSLIIGVDVSREVRRERITKRLHARLKEGMIEEVDGLLRKGVSAEDLIYYGLEYKYVTLYLTKQLTYQEMFDGLNVAIHQFAKRQMTWFRKMERDGMKIHWVDGMQPLEVMTDQVVDLLHNP